MNESTVGIIGIVVLLVILFMGAPIAFSLMLIGFIGISYLTSIEAALPLLSNTLFETTSYYPYTVIPLFVIMGGFAKSSGLTSEMYSTCKKWLTRLPGNLCVASICACACFSAISGSSIATAAAMGSVALPEMKRNNYHPKIATGSIAAGGTLGFLIPPSIGFVVYGMLTEQSIGKLLMAGVLPGIVLTFSFIGIIVLWVHINPDLAPATNSQFSWKARFLALKSLWEPIFLFFLVIGGIYYGIFTPTEAGAIGATVLLLITFFKKKITWRNLFASLQETSKLSVMIFFLISGAKIFGIFLALSNIPSNVALFASEFQTSPYIIIAFVILIYFILGCFLDAISMMVLTLPVIFPLVVKSGFDPVWFGVISVLMMEVGLITPPLGLNLFVVAGVDKEIQIDDVFRGVFPFVAAIILVVIIITIFPQIALFLPNLRY